MLELILMMTKGGPGGYTEVLPWYLYTTGFITLDIGYGASMAVMPKLVFTIILQKHLVRGLTFGAIDNAKNFLKFGIIKHVVIFY